MSALQVTKDHSVIKASIQLYEAATQLKPDNASYALNRANLFFAVNDVSDARLAPFVVLIVPRTVQNVKCF